MKPLLEAVFQQLVDRAPASVYASVVYECRSKKSVTVYPQSVEVDDKSMVGVNLRYLVGATMYEEATNLIDQASLNECVERLVQRVVDHGGQDKAYRSPTWAERVAEGLENDIVEQIPENPAPETWVHFGVRHAEDLPTDQAEMVRLAKETFSDVWDFRLSLGEDHPARNPDQLRVELKFATDEFLFIDSSVRMSQAITRNRQIPVLVKGHDRSFVLQGGIGGLESVSLDADHYQTLYDKLAKALTAERMSPGRYKLLMSPSLAGVFAHEAFGHSQEADTWARERSKARELYLSKQPVGNEHATILNNPAIYDNGDSGFGAWGSYFFDEEGWRAKKQYLVKSGVLQQPMTNLTSSLRLNIPRSANGKRENFGHAIYSRQTNTYFEQGDLTFMELIGLVDYGFLATEPFGGMEDPKGMGIQVGMQYLEEIRDGELTGQTFKAPNGGAVQMTGSVQEYLENILGRSKIDAFSEGPDESVHPWNELGGCGKYHKEFVEAGCGGPFLLVDKVLLG